MQHSKFTTKILLLTIAPMVFFFVAFLSIHLVEMDSLSSSTAAITEEGLQDIYRYNAKNRSTDIANKVSLKLDSVRNDLNIVRGTAQKIIDQARLASKDLKSKDANYLKNSLQYNPQKNLSSRANIDSDVSLNVWGYLHDQEGRINQPTMDYITLISPIMSLLDTVATFGSEKGWVYVIGPKETPVLLMAPWSDVGEDMDRYYPGHNINNWWDFFFPGLVEGWDKWITDDSLNIDIFNEQVTVTPLYEDAGGTGLMMTFFAPLWNKSRTENQGAAAIDYNIDNIIGLVGDEKIGETGFYFLLQSDGNILGMQEQWATVLGLHKEQQIEQVGIHKTYYKLGESDISDLRSASESILIQDFSTHHITDNEGKEFILAFKNVLQFNLWTGNSLGIKRDSLYIGMIVPKEEVMKLHYEIGNEIATVSRNSSISIISISIFFGIVAIIIATLYAIRETKQIRMMNMGLAAIKQKNFDTSIPVVSKDDLGALAQTFNSMALEIESTYTQLKNQTKELEKKVSERTLHLQYANQELERLSEIDTLTNVHNRRYLDAHLLLRWREHTRNQLPLSIIMIDIDYFKNYNDSYGHQAGDDCLCRVANALLKVLRRPTDILARYGGEEFCVVVSSEKEDAMIIANLLREAVEALNIEHNDSDKGTVSISVGVNSSIPSNDNELRQFINQADQALYKSKNDGRDKVFHSADQQIDFVNQT
jgi:sigma-B regulation protein RsbU (phosphoserine phosphatase)